MEVAVKSNLSIFLTPLLHTPKSRLAQPRLRPEPAHISFGRYKTPRSLTISALSAGLLTFIPKAATAQEPVKLDNAKTPSVNAASDIPEVNQSMKAPLVDLAHNPLLSSTTQQKLVQMLTELSATQYGQLAVVVIPGTNRPDLNDLATQIFNQIQLGDKGTNNGILLLINADGVRNAIRGKQMFVKPGNAFSDSLSADVATNILVAHAVPHLKQKNYDQAVLETVEALQAFMKDGKTSKVSPHKTTSSQQSEWAEETKVIIGVVLAYLALLLACAARDIQKKDKDMPRFFLALRLLEVILRVLIMVASKGKAGSGGSRGSSGGGGRGGFSRGGGGGI